MPYLADLPGFQPLSATAPALGVTGELGRRIGVTLTSMHRPGHS